MTAIRLVFQCRRLFRWSIASLSFAALACFAADLPDTTTAEARTFPGLFALYAANRVENRPNLVTEDLLVTAYAMLRERDAEQNERVVLLPALVRLVTGLEQKFPVAPRVDTSPAAPDGNRVSPFIAVLSGLLSGVAPIDPLAREEWQRVMDGAGIARSPLLGIMLDYAQFVPRARYAGDAALAAYFRCYRYAASAPWLLQPSAATGVDAVAVERNLHVVIRLTNALEADAGLDAAYRALSDGLKWQYGPAADAGLEQSRIALAAGGELAHFASELRRLAPAARIQDVHHEPALLASGETWQQATLSWRLLPSRQSTLSAVFQSLVGPDVGAYNGECAADAVVTLERGGQSKGYPRVLELLALAGSAAADQELLKRCDSRYSTYGSARTMARTHLPIAGGLDLEHLRFTAAAVADADTPERLNTLLGFWVWQRHDAALYARQSITAGGKSAAPPPSPRTGARLEGSAAFYDALQRLAVAQHVHGGMQAWLRFAELNGQLARIAWKQSFGGLPDPADERLLNEIDTLLQQLAEGRTDSPVLAVLHTHAADREVSVAALGRPEIVSHGLARGARMVSREFRQPLSAPVDDTSWQKSLESGALPQVDPGGAAPPSRISPNR